MKLFVCTVLLVASSLAAREKRGIYGEPGGLLSPSLYAPSTLPYAPISSPALLSAPLYSSPLRYPAPAPLLSSHQALLPHSAPLLVSHARPLHIGSPLRCAGCHSLPLSHSAHLSPALPLSHSAPLSLPLSPAPLRLAPSLPLSVYHSSPALPSYPLSYSHSLPSHGPVVLKAPSRYASGWW